MSVVVATSQKPYRPLIDVGFDLLMDSADRLKKDLREEPKV